MRWSKRDALLQGCIQQSWQWGVTSVCAKIIQNLRGEMHWINNNTKVLPFVWFFFLVPTVQYLDSSDGVEELVSVCTGLDLKVQPGTGECLVWGPQNCFCALRRWWPSAHTRQFAVKCEAVGMRVITSLPENGAPELLLQVKEFKYLGVLFTSEGKMDREMDMRIGAAAAVMRGLYQTVMVKRELSRKAKLSIYQSIYVPASPMVMSFG